MKYEMCHIPDITYMIDIYIAEPAAPCLMSVTETVNIHTINVDGKIVTT